jgi:histidine phosphotransferase ChpT
MTSLCKLGEMELAALVCSKVCHDIANPVGAMLNGLEVLAEDLDGEMRDEAIMLVRKSLDTANARLQFARLAYGAAGSAGAALDLGSVRQVAEAYVSSEKVSMSWQSPLGELAKDHAKLLLNLVLIGHGAIPFGGTVAIVVDDDLTAPHFRIDCAGRRARITEDLLPLFRGETEPAEVNARNIQPFFAGMLARSAGADVTIAENGEDAVRIEARIGA